MLKINKWKYLAIVYTVTIGAVVTYGLVALAKEVFSG